jgi:hypothetical protein
MVPRVTGAVAAQVVAAMALGCGGEAPPAASGCRPPPAAAGAWSVAAFGGPTLHWDDAGCVAVTYDPAFAPHLDALRAAIADWNGLACGAMCYAPPTPSAQRPARESRSDRRVHLRPTMSLSPLESSIYADRGTGQILGADLAVPTTKVAADIRGAFARALGQALGMRASAAAEPSVLASELRWRTSAPTAGDRARVCAVYAPPWCAE